MTSVPASADSVLATLLPNDVRTVEARGDLSEGGLYPVEAEHVRRAVPKRRREFATGRACARAALSNLGIRAQAIPVAANGAPSWPRGIVGSITHCDGFRACAVATRTRYLGLGIDAEPDAHLPPGLLDDIATSAEIAMMQHAAGDKRVKWDRLLFCAKESVYKTWNPISGVQLAFHDVEVFFDCSAGGGGRSGKFRACLVHTMSPEPPSNELQGAWAARDGLLLAATTLTVMSFDPQQETHNHDKAKGDSY